MSRIGASASTGSQTVPAGSLLAAVATPLRACFSLTALQHGYGVALERDDELVTGAGLGIPCRMGKLWRQEHDMAGLRLETNAARAAFRRLSALDEQFPAILTVPPETHPRGDIHPHDGPRGHMPRLWRRRESVSQPVRPRG